MAIWSPISGVMSQYDKSAAAGGGPASGYYLKFYDITNTPISMASASDGSGLLAKAQLDSSGYPINGSSDRFIPFISEDYRPALYTNATDADADTIANADWFPGTTPRISITDGIDSTGFFDTISDMLLITVVVDDVYSAGGTTWRVDTISNPLTIEDFTALSPIRIQAFGALENGSNSSPALQAAIDYGAPKDKRIDILGKFTWSSTVNLLDRTAIMADGSENTVTPGIGILFNASRLAADPAIDYITIEGGVWTENSAAGTGTVTFFNGQGDYNAGTPSYVNRSSFSRIRVLEFNYFMVSDFHRTWNVTDCFIRSKNGFKIMRKNVETNILDCLIFGTALSDATTIGIDVGTDIDGGTHPGMYPEGFKVAGCTIDQFGASVRIREVLDLNFTDNWIGASPAHLTHHCLKFELNTNGNNFMSGIHFNHNTYFGGVIEFVSHAGSPTQMFMQMSDETYLFAQLITVGQRWYNVNMSDWVFQLQGSPGTAIGITCINENVGCSFNNLHFKGNYTGLIHVNSNLSLETRINNVWSDVYVNEPFFIETPIRITNSSAGRPLENTASVGGQIIYMGKPTSAIEGVDIFTSGNLRFKLGAYVQVRVQGLFNNTSAFGELQIQESTGGVLQESVQGAGWTTSNIELTNSQVRLDAVCIFRCIDDAITTINILSQTGDTSMGDQSAVTIMYI